MTIETRTLTPEQRATYAEEALHDFSGRALVLAERIAHAAHQGETKVVEQYLLSLQSLRAEAEGYGWLADRRTDAT